jgi:uncharacterized protein YhaN
MKLRQLRLAAFGCFADARLDFGVDGGFLHVIHGPNEAGKSTSLRALTGLLFGIPVRSTDDFRHKSKDLRIGAEIVSAAGQRATFVRRKGSKDTLLDRDEQKLPDAALKEFLGPVTEETFRTVYRLDYASLRLGGDDLLAGKGDLAESLFQAGSGIAGVRQVLKSLESDASQLFANRSSKALVNRGVSEFDAATKTVRELSVKPSDYVALVDSLAKKEAELKRLVEQMEYLDAQVRHNERMQRALPDVTEHGRLLAERTALGDVILLSESASRDREQAVRDRDDAQRRRQHAESQVEQLREQLKGLPLRSDLLSQSQNIARLNQEVRSYQDALRDLPKVQSEQQQFEADARRLLAELRPDLSLEQADSLRLTGLQSERIRQLTTDFTKRDERRRSAAHTVEDTERETGEAQRLLDADPSASSPDELKRLAERIRRKGDLEESLRTDETVLRTAEEQARLELQRLTCWRGTLEELEALLLPTSETVDQFEREFDALAKQTTPLDQQIERNREETARCAAELQRLQLSGGVPSESNLKSARDRRDHGWQLIRRTWLDGTGDTVAEAAFAHGQPLPDAYEQTVVKADNIADRLRREAERVAQQAHFQAEQQRLNQQTGELSEQRCGLDDRQTELTSRWQESWKPAGITPLTPREMRAWLNRHAALLEKARRIREQRSTVAESKNRIATFVNELSQALQNLAEPPHDPRETLAGLLQRADATHKRLENARQQRDRLQERLQELSRKQTQDIRTRDQADAAIAEWQADWRKAVGPLNLSEDVPPEQANALLDRLAQLEQLRKEAVNRHSRVVLMEGSIRQFQTAVAALTESLAPEWHGLPADQAAARLNAAINTASDERGQHQQLAERLNAERQAVTDSKTDAQQAQQRLDDLMAAARCSDLAALEEAERKSSQARGIVRDLQDVEKRLALAAAGAPLEEFLNEVAELDADRLPGQIARLQAELAELQPRRDHLIGDIRSLKDDLRKQDGTDAAIAAAETAQASLAVVRDGAERYIRLRLAARILGRYLDDFRERNQHPVIARAGELFPRLTLGSFSRLKVGFDDRDQPSLFGVRPDCQEVDMEGMSDGTRDQLFLSLRLASLETQLSAGEPLPFVVDDILIHFDDDRAKAALEVLAEFSRHTQVLLFTHHTRIRDLARDSVPPSLLKLHELTPNR